MVSSGYKEEARDSLEPHMRGSWECGICFCSAAKRLESIAFVTPYRGKVRIVWSQSDNLIISLDGFVVLALGKESGYVGLNGHVRKQSSSLKI